MPTADLLSGDVRPSSSSSSSRHPFRSSSSLSLSRPSASPSRPHSSLPRTDEQMAIAQQFAEIMQQNEMLAKENRLFDSFLQRHAHMLDDLDVSLLSGSPASATASASRRQPSRAMQDPTLTDLEKHSLSVDELEYRGAQLKALETKSRDDLTLLHSITAGIQQRIVDLRKETYEFQRDVVVGGCNARSGQLMAEKVVRYFEQSIAEKADLADKLRLKNKTMKAARAKMEAQVKQKEEQGDSLHSIDFHQLQIKNSQFNQKIKERNDELLKLKLTTGRTVAILNSLKKSLSDCLIASKRIRRDIKEKYAARERMKDELSRVSVELRDERVRNRQYKIQQSNPDMPQVMDYVLQKSEMYELEAAIRNWQRKVEIMEMAAKRARRVLDKQGQGGGGNSNGNGHGNGSSTIQRPISGGPTFAGYQPSTPTSPNNQTHFPRIR